MTTCDCSRAKGPKSIGAVAAFPSSDPPRQPLHDMTSKDSTDQAELLAQQYDRKTGALLLANLAKRSKVLLPWARTMGTRSGVVEIMDLLPKEASAAKVPKGKAATEIHKALVTLAKDRAQDADADQFDPESEAVQAEAQEVLKSFRNVLEDIETEMTRILTRAAIPASPAPVDTATKTGDTRGERGVPSSAHSVRPAWSDMINAVKAQETAGTECMAVEDRPEYGVALAIADHALTNQPTIPPTTVYMPELAEQKTLECVIEVAERGIYRLAFVHAGEAGVGHLVNVKDATERDELPLLKKDGSRVRVSMKVQYVPTFMRSLRGALVAAHSSGHLTIEDAKKIVKTLLDKDVVSALAEGTLTEAFRLATATGTWRSQLREVRAKPGDGWYAKEAKDDQKDKKDKKTKKDGKRPARSPTPSSDGDSSSDDEGGRSSRRAKRGSSSKDARGHSDRDRRRKPGSGSDSDGGPRRGGRGGGKGIAFSARDSRSPSPRREATRPPTPPSYDRKRGGSKFSKFVCYAYMFDKKGCTDPGCKYSHKKRVVDEYRAKRAAEKGKDAKSDKKIDSDKRKDKKAKSGKSDKRSDKRADTSDSSDDSDHGRGRGRRGSRD